MSALDKFNQVEQALKAKAESLKSQGLVRSVSIAAHGPVAYSPAILLWIRRGWGREVKVGRSSKLHTWRFEYVIDVVGSKLDQTYEDAKKILWALYDNITQDPSLGITGYYVNAKPATEFERYELTSEAGRMEGHRLILAVDVEVEV